MNEELKDHISRHVTAHVNIYANYVHIETNKYYFEGKDLLNAEDVGEKAAEANGELFAEAFTVFTETGLTPKEMSERVHELETMVRLYSDMVGTTGYSIQKDYAEHLYDESGKLLTKKQ